MDQTMMEVAPATVLARKIPTAQLAERARTGGAELVGPGGFQAELTKRALEAGLAGCGRSASRTCQLAPAKPAAGFGRILAVPPRRST